MLGARPFSGHGLLHGVRGGKHVHIGAGAAAGCGGSLGQLHAADHGKRLRRGLQARAALRPPRLEPARKALRLRRKAARKRAAEGCCYITCREAPCRVLATARIGHTCNT